MAVKNLKELLEFTQQNNCVVVLLVEDTMFYEWSIHEDVIEYPSGSLVVDLSKEFTRDAYGSLWLNTSMTVGFCVYVATAV